MELWVVAAVDAGCIDLPRTRAGNVISRISCHVFEAKFEFDCDFDCIPQVVGAQWRGEGPGTGSQFYCRSQLKDSETYCMRQWLALAPCPPPLSDFFSCWNTCNTQLQNPLRHIDFFLPLWLLPLLLLLLLLLPTVARLAHFALSFKCQSSHARIEDAGAGGVCERER